ncbi:MAG TPA: crosslink repair DNA glycosylase YcaQ family protein [Candidatus Lumbricidophila sp.]|nr:crosslink repair DNA glycosylase YcaQ family protein [Candidatus Lumbricidophila sp.]
MDELSSAQARRIALAAAGFGRQRAASPRARRTTVPGGTRTPGSAALRREVARLGLLQIDSVNVFERSHYLPMWSRLGAYDRAALDRFTTGHRGEYFEYWAHEAALIPRAWWPHFEFRRDRYRTKGTAWGGYLRENAALADWLRAELAANGPMRASAIEHDANERRGPWWGWSEVKIALEWMLRTGDVVCIERQRFERVYALPEQALSSELLGQSVERGEALRQLIGHAASALGVATLADLADYFRMLQVDIKPTVHELVDEGTLIEVTVANWNTGSRRTAAYLHRDAAHPRRIDHAALVSPFDPIVWFRPRTERLFDFHYRIEIYTPAPKRIFGYLCLPYVLDDQIVGRVDLKADRKAKTLRVQAAWAEPGAPADAAAARLVPVLRDAAAWQGLTDITIVNRGSLAPALAAEFGA